LFCNFSNIVAYQVSLLPKYVTSYLGYKSSKCADSAETAASMATEELFDLLIRLKFIDSDSLHHKPVLATRPPGQLALRVGSKRLSADYFIDLVLHCFNSLYRLSSTLL